MKREEKDYLNENKEVRNEHGVLMNEVNHIEASIHKLKSGTKIYNNI